MNNDLISREALREAINTYDTFACLPDGKLYPVRELEHPEMFVAYIHVEDVIKAIDNAPTVLFPLTVQIIDKVTDEDKETLKQLMKDCKPQILNLKTERPQGKFVDISKLRLMTVEECAGHTIEYAMGWKACIEWIKKGGAE